MQSEGEEQSSESSSSGNRTSGFHSPNGWYLQELRYRNFWRKSHPALQPKDTWQVYEIEVPNTVVGLLIGVKGKTIQELSYRAHVIMTILPHNNPELTADYQVCQLRGERENINRALRFLRQRYPENRFPDLDLKRVLAPSFSLEGLVRNTQRISFLPILPGQICDVTMTFAVNVAQFFLQQPNDPTFSQLNELHTQLNIFYRNWPNYPIVTVPMHANETQYCAVYMGNTFVRGATVGYIVESDEMMVRLIDLGGYISHPRSTLRKLCEEAFHLPGQAIASQLAYVKPLTVHFDPRGEAVIKELCIGKRIKARCLGYTLDSSQALVELYVTFPDQKIERLDMFLRQNNFAAPSEMVAYSPTVPALFFQNRV